MPEPLGDALRRLVPRSPANADPDVAELVELPTTEQLGRIVDLCEARLLAVCPDHYEKPAEHVHAGDVCRFRAGRLQDAERRWNLGAVRDRMAETAGCWCLGHGGRGERGLYLTDESPRYENVGGQADLLRVGRGGFYGTIAYAEYCDCPVGAQKRKEHLDAALAAREAAQSQRRVELWRASIPPEFEGVTLSGYPIRQPEQRQALELVEMWLERGNWLYLWGQVGRGKTSLAIAAAAESRMPSLYVSVPDMLSRLRATYDGDGREAEVLDSLLTVPLLILDDLGKQNNGGWATEKLYEVVDRRWREHRRLIVTSNGPLDDLPRALGDAGAAIESRIRSRAMPYVVEVVGPDLRQETLP